MTRRGGGAAVALVAVVLSALALLAPAGAQEQPRSLALRRVDSQDQSKTQVVFQYDGPAGDVAGAKAQENGKDVAVRATPAADAGLTPAVMFVVDASTSTDTDALLAETRKAIQTYVKALPKGTQAGVVTTGSAASLLQRLTSDPALLDRAASALTPSGDGGLWEGVGRAAAQFKGDPKVIPTIVLFTDGNAGKGTPYEDAKGAVSEVGAEVFAIGLAGPELGGDARALAEATGGAYLEAAKAVDVGPLLSQAAARINGLYAFTYESKAPAGVNDLTVSVGGASTRNSFVAGSLARGAAGLAYQAPATTSGFEPLQNNLGKLLAVLLGLLAAALFAYGLITIVVRDDTGLSSALQPYSEGYVARDGDEDDADQGLAQTPFVQRAVELTGQFAERQGFLVKVEGALERANLPLRAAEAMFFYVAGAVVATLLVLALTRNIVSALIAAVLLGLAAPGILNFMASRRKRQFEMQLPDTLQLLSGTLRAGYSMMQGVEAVSQEVQEPMGRELRRVVTEARLGRPLEESLDAVAERMGSTDFGWATMAIRIQREVGGNLAELLMTVAETMTQRERLRRDVKALTAEGRVSAYVLGILPIGLAGAMYVINPDYMTTLFTDGRGQVALALGVTLMLGGFVWMSRIIKIDV